MTDFPDLKMKAVVQFPARIDGGAGIDVTKSNGTYRFDIDLGDFAPPIGSVSDVAHQTALIWNTITGIHTLVPLSLLSGGSIIEAPNDGTQYGRQSLGWTASLPVVGGNVSVNGEYRIQNVQFGYRDTDYNVVSNGAANTKIWMGSVADPVNYHEALAHVFSGFNGVPIVAALSSTEVEILVPVRLTNGLQNYADDTAAAAGGIPLHGLYRTASAVKIRVT